ncbi:MAG: peptide chain release factor N(5)-glutamine methyltransferase [Gammaproteobacteria bacterium]|nr:peptide chain release factor N(5)-glutamine methyltransferase [Gammaproteobacteria bacterium]
MDASKHFSTIRAAITTGTSALGRASESARLDAEVLLALAVSKNRAWLYGNDDAPLSDNAATVYQALLAERARGVPLAHLTGTREFWSMEFAVDAHTLVPRPETELLVELALKRMPAGQPARVLDLGTGTGAVAIAIATERPHAELVATDISDAALSVAKTNAERHCPGRIEFRSGDWFEVVADETFDLIVANPPYIAADETELTDPDLAFEPVDALYSGADGLDAIRTIAAGAPSHLQTGGALLLEHGFAQADGVSALLAAAGFESVDNVADLAGQPRVTIGIKP